MSLLDFFGAAAQVGGQMLSRENELEDKRRMEAEREARQEEMQRKQAELQEERQKRIMEFQMELGIRKQEEANKRYSDDSDKVDKRAGEIGTERDVKTANRVAPSVDAGVMDIIKSKLSPQEQEKYYGVKQQTQSGIIADRISAAREIGADPKLREDLKGDYKEATGKEGREAALSAKTANQAALLEFKEAQLALQQASSRAETSLATQRLELAKAKLENGGSTAENLNGIAANLGQVLKQKEMLEAKLEIADDDKKPAIQKELDVLNERARKFGKEQDRQLDGRASRGDKANGNAPTGGQTKAITKAEYDKLPSGTRFTAPDGTIRIKP